jgi:hypothetical protein
MTTQKWRTMLTRADVHQPAVYSAANLLVADKQKSDVVTRDESLAANAQAKVTGNSDQQQARPQDNPSTVVLTPSPAATVSTGADISAKATSPPTMDAKAENMISPAEESAPPGKPCTEEAGQPAQDVAGSKRGEKEGEKVGETEKEKGEDEKVEEEQEGISSTAAFPSFSLSQVEYVNVPHTVKNLEFNLHI